MRILVFNGSPKGSTAFPEKLLEQKKENENG